MRRCMTIAGLAVLVAAAGGCGWNDAVDSRAATAGLPSLQADVEARDWVLDPDDSSITVGEATPVTLAVDGDVVSGTAPCNAYRGTIDLGDDGSVEISDLAATRRACERPVMEAETEFLAALEAVDHAEVDVDDEGRDDRDRLTLTGPDGVELGFSSFDARDLLIGEWTLVDVNTGDAIQSMVLGTEPTLRFDDDGTMAIDTGCNTGGADWELDGDEITVEAARTTLRACEGDVMDQETAILAALEGAERVEVAPGSLTLLDGDGRIALVAVQA
jgi:heat shock protein HslJ